MSDVERQGRPLSTNPSSLCFKMKLPVVQRNTGDVILQKRLAEACRSIGDAQNKTTNVQASMTPWFMHDTIPDFMEVCDRAIQLARDNSPAVVSLTPYDCWGVVYAKGEHTQPHDHWPQTWSWVYNVECCDNCAPLVFDDASPETRCIAPTRGNMILFPGWLKHSVPAQPCDHERIVLAGNLSANSPNLEDRRFLEGLEVGAREELIASHSHLIAQLKGTKSHSVS